MAVQDTSDIIGAQPSNSVIQGMQVGTEMANSAHSWATSQANVDIARTHAQNEMDQIAIQKKEFEAKAGSQKMQEFKDWSGMQPGPTKNLLGDKWQQKWNKVDPGSVDDSWVQAGKDAAYSPQLGNIINQVMTHGQNPALKEAVDGIYGSFLNDATRNEFSEKAVTAALQGVNQLNAVALRNQGAMDRTKDTNQTKRDTAKTAADAVRSRIEAGFIKNAQSTYDQGVKPITFALDGIARMDGMFDKAESGEIKTNKQFRSLVSNEAARVATQKSNYGEGTAEAMAINSYSASLKDFLSKIENEPEDTLSQDFINQEKAVFKEMKDQYMQAHDRMAVAKMGGATPVQKQAITGRAEAFQKEYGEKFGGWTGGGLGEKSPSSAIPATAPAQPAAPPAQSPPELLQKYEKILEAYKKNLAQGTAESKAQAAEIMRRLKAQAPADIKQKLGIQ